MANNLTWIHDIIRTKQWLNVIDSINGLCIHIVRIAHAYFALGSPYSLNLQRFAETRFRTISGNSLI